MSAKIVSDVIKNCGVNLNPEDCVNDVDGKCILSITLNCFQNMLDNVLATAEVLNSAGQVGGSGGPEPEPEPNFDSVVPYLQAYNITKINAATSVPSGILSTVYGGQTKDGAPYWIESPMGEYLSDADIKALSTLL